MKSRYLAMVLSLMSSAAMADSQIGNVVQPDYSGATGTRAVSSATLEELHYNRDVFAGETVKTPTDGSTVIKFQDLTQIQVGHNSTIVLDSFVYDPQTAASTGAITFSKGVFRFISGTASDKRWGYDADHHHGHQRDPGPYQRRRRRQLRRRRRRRFGRGDALRRRKRGHPDPGPGRPRQRRLQRRRAHLSCRGTGGRHGVE